MLPERAVERLHRPRAELLAELLGNGRVATRRGHCPKPVVLRSLQSGRGGAGGDGDSSGSDRVAEGSRFRLGLAPSRIRASQPPRSRRGWCLGGRRLALVGRFKRVGNLRVKGSTGSSGRDRREGFANPRGEFPADYRVVPGKPAHGFHSCVRVVRGALYGRAPVARWRGFFRGIAELASFCQRKGRLCLSCTGF